MSIQLTPALEARREYADRVHSVEGMLRELLEQNARAASALWDLRKLDRRPVLMLALSDPWGYASSDFAPEELCPARVCAAASTTSSAS